MLRRRLVGSRVGVIALLMVLCLILAFAVWYLFGPSPRRWQALGQKEAARVLLRFTGQKLPTNIEDFQAILYDDTFTSRESLPRLYLAFRTDEEGCSHILNQFHGPNARVERFSEQSLGSDRWLWDFRHFSAGCSDQAGLGMVLFDRDLLDAIQQAQVHITAFPEDVYYAQSPSCGAVVLMDRRVVYLYALHVR